VFNLRRKWSDRGEGECSHNNLLQWLETISRSRFLYVVSVFINTCACILELYDGDDLYRKKGFYRAYLHDQ
jgi:hypothetical protein